MMTTKMGERDSTEEIAKAFKLFDDDNTGKINFKNLKRVAKELGENMTDEELQVDLKYTAAKLPHSHLAMHHILTNENWIGTRDKSVRLWLSLQEMIDEADRDGDGEVSLQEFERIMKVCCANVSKVKCLKPDF